jgi:hypothetical protein
VVQRLLERSRSGCGTAIPALDAAAVVGDSAAPPAC